MWILFHWLYLAASSKSSRKLFGVLVTILQLYFLLIRNLRKLNFGRRPLKLKNRFNLMDFFSDFSTGIFSPSNFNSLRTDEMRFGALASFLCQDTEFDSLRADLALLLRTDFKSGDGFLDFLGERDFSLLILKSSNSFVRPGVHGTYKMLGSESFFS